MTDEMSRMSFLKYGAGTALAFVLGCADNIDRSSDFYRLEKPISTNKAMSVDDPAWKEIAEEYVKHIEEKNYEFDNTDAGEKGLVQDYLDHLYIDSVLQELPHLESKTIQPGL